MFFASSCPHWPSQNWLPRTPNASALDPGHSVHEYSFTFVHGEVHAQPFFSIPRLKWPAHKLDCLRLSFPALTTWAQGCEDARTKDRGYQSHGKRVLHFLCGQWEEKIGKQRKIGHICLRQHDWDSGIGDTWSPQIIFLFFFEFLSQCPFPRYSLSGHLSGHNACDFHCRCKCRNQKLEIFRSPSNITHALRHPIPSDPIRYDPKRVELRHVHLISWRVYSTVQYSFFCLSQFAVYFIIITIIFLWLTLGTICPVTASFMGWVSRSFILLSTLRLRNLLSNCRYIFGLSKHSQHLDVGIRTCIDLDLKPGRFMGQPSMRMPWNDS